MGCAYIKCAGSASSSISNANNYFAAGMVSYSTSQNKLFMASLVGGSGTDAGKPSGNQNSFQPLDSSGTSITASPYTYYTPGQPTCLHWDSSSRRLYLMCAYTNNRCHLFVYYMNGSTFGHTGFSIASYDDRANVVIDWQSQSSGSAYMIESMSGDSTHLYVGYLSTTLASNGGYSTRIRKIPLSGNLSWASGSDMTGTLDTDVAGTITARSILVQSATGTYSGETLEAMPRYYKTVSSVPKFLGHGNSTNKLREFALNVPVIGESEGSFSSRQNQTQYLRIK